MEINIIMQNMIEQKKKMQINLINNKCGNGFTYFINLSPKRLNQTYN